jgi:hypothetical protein
MQNKLNCAFCKNKLQRSELKLGKYQPLNMTSKEKKMKLAISVCPKCGLTQLQKSFTDAKNFPPEYSFRSGQTNMLNHSFTQLAARIEEKFPLGGRILDIGCNDLTLLRKFSSKWKKFGIDPLTIYSKYIDIEIKNGFYPETNFENTQFDVIVMTNTLAHISKPFETLEIVWTQLKQDGLLAIEVVDIDEMALLGEFDKFTHEHRLYLSQESIKNFLLSKGFDVLSLEKIKNHGGSLRILANKRNPLEIRQIEDPILAKNRLKSIDKKRKQTLKEWKKLIRKFDINTENLIGLGYTNRGVILLTNLRISPRFIVDKDSSKAIGRKVNNFTQVISDTEFMKIQSKDSLCIILAWHIQDEIMSNYKKMGYKGKFILIIPTIKIV